DSMCLIIAAVILYFLSVFNLFFLPVNSCDPPTTPPYAPSLHDALPIFGWPRRRRRRGRRDRGGTSPLPLLRSGRMTEQGRPHRAAAWSNGAQRIGSAHLPPTHRG